MNLVVEVISGMLRDTQQILNIIDNKKNSLFNPCGAEELLNITNNLKAKLREILEIKILDGEAPKNNTV